jgi:hypothetical protein
MYSLMALRPSQAVQAAGASRHQSAGLPVKLISFTATGIKDEYIKLDWSTAVEINNMGFEVERSEDGQTFTKLGWVARP